MGANDRDHLVEEHIGLARNIARSIARRSTRMDRDAVESDACLGLLKAATAFDATRGVPFRLYAGRWIAGEVIDGLRNRTLNRWRVWRPCIYSLDAMVESQHGTLAECVISREPPVGYDLEFRDLLDEFLYDLPPQWQQDIRDLVDGGMTQKEIADQYKTSQSAVAQRLRKVRKRAAQVLRNLYGR